MKNKKIKIEERIVRDHSNDPFVLRKVELAKKASGGFPKEFMEPRAEFLAGQKLLRQQLRKLGIKIHKD